MVLLRRNEKCRTEEVEWAVLAWDLEENVSVLSVDRRFLIREERHVISKTVQNAAVR